MSGAPHPDRFPTLLLVEEDDDARCAYAHVLSELGLEVVSASDVTEAADAMECCSPDALLVEWRARRGDGRTTAELVRDLRDADPTGGGRPVVLFSAALDLADQARAIGARHCSFPLDLDRLVRVVFRASGLPILAYGPELARTRPRRETCVAAAR